MSTYHDIRKEHSFCQDESGSNNLSQMKMSTYNDIRKEHSFCLFKFKINEYSGSHQIESFNLLTCHNYDSAGGMPHIVHCYPSPGELHTRHIDASACFNFLRLQSDWYLVIWKLKRVVKK